MEEVKCSEAYSTAKTIIRASINDTKQNFIYIGHYLKEIRDNRLYQEDGYADFDTFMAGEVGKDKGWASRCINVADQFGIVEDGQPVLAEEYQDYSLSLLIEMVAMTPEQRELVTPDTEVKQAREIKKADKEKSCESQLPKPEPLSAYGTPKKVYPPDSYVTTKGCEGGHSCYCCHLECGIRQEMCHCVYAPLGNPFSCTTLNTIENLREEMGEVCQFVNLEKAYHRVGDHEPVPCCKECGTKCGYACQISVKQSNSEHTEPDQEQPPIEPEKSEWVNQEEEQVDESYSFAGIPRASERYVTMLARMFVQDRVQQLVSGRTVNPDDERIKEQISRYSLSKHNLIEIGDGVIAYAALEYIEFYREDEDLGICLYGRFANIVRKQLDEYMQEQAAAEKERDPEEQSAEQETIIDAEFKEVPPADEYTPEYFLSEQQENLDEMLKAFESGDPRNVPHKLLERQKTIVAALTAMVSSLEQEEQSGEHEQPELPILKNNDQRKAWIKDYKAWGLWYRDENIDVNYYKYDFDNGSRLIAEEYLQRESSWENKKYDQVYYHLVQKNKRKYRSDATYDEKFNHSSTGESEIVEYLKQIQKKGKG